MKGTQFEVKARTIAIGNSQLNLWCDRAKHTWIGTLAYRGYTFESSADDPLQFQVWKGRGYVYVKGTGRVRTPDHRTIELPPAPAPTDQPAPAPTAGAVPAGAKIP